VRHAAGLGRVFCIIAQFWQSGAYYPFRSRCPLQPVLGAPMYGMRCSPIRYQVAKGTAAMARIPTSATEERRKTIMPLLLPSAWKREADSSASNKQEARRAITRGVSQDRTPIMKPTGPSQRTKDKDPRIVQVKPGKRCSGGLVRQSCGETACQAGSAAMERTAKMAAPRRRP
jgi:hypothetical protein